MAEHALEHLHRLLGTWTIKAVHPAMPDTIVHGTAAAEWLEGEHFLIQRAQLDHPDFPDFIAVIGATDIDRVDPAPAGGQPGGEPELTMHYFDSRGVFRVYDLSLDDHEWRISRLVPGFSQRFTGTFSDGGNTIEGLWEMRTDDVTWNDDLAITYRRNA